jgi:Lon protease-like protein
MSAAGELPLFPLGTVLFPGGPLQLRIFEPRYLDMVRQCLRGSRPFGVVLILEGLEAGAAASVATIGTSARLVDFDYLPDDAPCALPAELAHLGELLREVLPQLGERYAHVTAHYDDAGWVGNRWAEVLPLTCAERQQLLELADPLTRLTQVAAWSTRKPATSHV